ncbi:ATP-binding protein [Nibricoccus sp. IMCC34717]|uniref:ATP-binding protein n=1 Tax=Nibricoccus sp. IMCC34717 TaxID=3034021 RepID=UPI00384B584B
MASAHPILADFLLNVCGLVFLGIGLLIYRANALRSANRAFAIQMLIAGIWTFNYGFSVQPGANSVVHLRVGAAVASLLPWVLAWVREVIASTESRPGVARRIHLFWGSLSLVLLASTPFDAFVSTHPAPDGANYGSLWIGYHLVLCLMMARIAITGYARLRGIQGRRRDEMWIAVIAAAGTIAVVSAFMVVASTRATLPPAEYALIVIAYAFTLAWVIMVRGIYDARALVKILARTGGLVLTLAALFLIGSYGLQWMTPMKPAIANACASIGAAAIGVAIMRPFLRGENEILSQSIGDFQRQVNELVRGAVSTDLAIAHLERLLAKHAGTSSAYLLSEVQPGVFQRGAFRLPHSAVRWQQTHHTDWATASAFTEETLKAEPILEWVHAEGITLILASQRSAHNITLAVALGPRADEQTFTFFELESLALMVESAAAALTTLEASAQAQHAGQMMAIGMISASVIHEVKQPLAALRLFFKMLPSRYQDGEFRSEYFEVIPRELARIEETLSQLLRLGRSETYSITAFSPKPLVVDTLTLVQPKAASSFVDIRQHFEAVPEIRGDPIVFKQALLNLALNAIEAMAIQAGRARILIVEGKIVDGHFELLVRDSGPGIPQSILSRLFRPFVTTKEDGVGLGLYITRDQVTKTGGNLRAHNHEEGGAVFVLRYPLASASALSSTDASPQPQSAA